MKRIIKRVFELYSKYIPLLILIALPAGVFLAKYVPAIMNGANFLVGKLIDGIVFLAPFAIFIIFAPSFAKMLKARKESSFAGFIIFWFGFTRILAGIWAAIFTVLILGLPLASSVGSDIGFGALVVQNLVVLKDLLLKSVFFWSLWLSAIVGIIAYYQKKLYDGLQKAVSTIETLGDYIEPCIPFLMLLLGAYIYSLPNELQESVSGGALNALAQSNLGKIEFIGLFTVDINSEFGLVWVYIIGSVLIGIGCMLWQIMQLLILKRYDKSFSIKDFITKYYFRIYPLAWATSSEVISMPLNMSLIKRKYKKITPLVRRLVVGLGAYMNINGTTMHVILLAGIVAVLVGYRPSLLQLVFGVPIRAIIGTPKTNCSKDGL